MTREAHIHIHRPRRKTNDAGERVMDAVKTIEIAGQPVRVQKFAFGYSVFGPSSLVKSFGTQSYGTLEKLKAALEAHFTSQGQSSP